MSRSTGAFADLATRVERLVYRGSWPARLAARLGYAPKLRVSKHRMVFPSLGFPPRPLRIAFASDFHAGPTTHPDVLRAACEALSAARPDLLLLGGDFVCTEATPIRELAPQLGAVPAPLGRYAVLGNHDWWTDAARIARALEEVGIQVVTNRNLRLPAPYDHLVLCGIDDPWAGVPDAAKAFDGADGVRIVLMHQPSNLLDVGREPFALALCGHTHGGQIALPGGSPIVVPHGPLSRRYCRGRFDVNGGEMIVSVGVGCTMLPFRLFADPEVIVIDVEFAAGAAVRAGGWRRG